MGAVPERAAAGWVQPKRPGCEALEQSESLVETEKWPLQGKR